MPSFAFRNLGTVTDDVHALFDGWDADGTMDASLDPTGALVLRLAVHEWIANLVQHAYFRREPRIAMDIAFEPAGVAVAIEDSSEGFDFAQQLGTQRALLDSPAPSERGRGLLMLITCADDIGFRPASNGQSQRIAFAIRPPHDDVSFASLFRPDDLEPDFDPTFGDAPPPGDGTSDAVSAPHPTEAPPPPDR